MFVCMSFLDIFNEICFLWKSTIRGCS
jgi:hypothetical protein